MKILRNLGFIPVLAVLGLSFATPALGMEGYTVKSLISAINNTNKEKVIAIIQSYPYLVNQAEGTAGNTPFHAAAKKKDPFFAQILLKAGANPWIKNKNEKTPLDIALEKENEQIVSILIGEPEQPTTCPAPQPKPKPMPGTIQSTENITDLDVVELYENKRNVKMEDKFGRTALLIACQKGDMLEIKKILNKGADINYPDLHGNTPLMLAAKGGFAEIVRLLLESGATVNFYNRKKQTALNFALAAGKQEVVTILAKKDAKLFFTTVISFIPPQIDNTACAMYEYVVYAFKNQKKNIEELPYKDIHVSLLYCSFFIEYDEEMLTITTESIFDEVYRLVQSYQLNTKLIQFAERNPLQPLGLEKLGAYLVIRYSNPIGYEEIMNNLFKTIKRGVQVPVVQTYGTEQKPHVSFAKKKIGAQDFEGDLSKIKPRGIKPLDADAFKKGTYELNMRIPGKDPKNINKKLFEFKKFVWNKAIKPAFTSA